MSEIEKMKRYIERTKMEKADNWRRGWSGSGWTSSTGPRRTL